MENNCLQEWRHLSCSLPDGWQNDRVKDLVSLRQEKTEIHDDTEDYIELEDIESGTGRLLSRRNTLEVESAVTLFKQGDILFGKLRPYLEKYYYADFDGKCTGEIISFEPKKIQGRFFYYFVASKDFIDKCDALAYGAKMPRVNWPTQIALFDVPIPPDAEQDRISAYLDKQCAVIDKVLEIKKEQLVILEELRESIIHKAVTKGLDGNVKLVDSGIVSIGKIPLNWKIDRIKDVAEIITGNTPSKDDPDNYENGTVPWIKPDQLRGDTVNDSEEKLSEKGADFARFVTKDAILVGCIGDVGNFAVAGCRLTTNQQINSLFFNERVHKPFARYLVEIARDEHKKNATLVVVPILNKNRQGQIFLALPPISEQIKIQKYLDEKVGYIESSKKNIREQILTLDSYRMSLIHECVTGKRRITEHDLKELTNV